MELFRNKDRYIYIKDNHRLIVETGEKEIMDLNLLPSVGISFDIWEQDGDLAHGKLTNDGGEVTIESKDNMLIYRWEGKKDYYEDVNLFSNSLIEGIGWQTFQYIDQDKFWDRYRTTEVSISSSRDCPQYDDGHQGLLDPGDTPCGWLSNVPVRACVFQLSRTEWLGLSLPGPLPAGQTTFCMKHGKFYVSIRHFMPSCEGGFFPTVYFIFGLSSSDDVLTTHADLTRKAGYWRARTSHPEWWGLPIWGAYDEVASAGSNRVQPSTPEESILTQDQLSKWINQVEELSGLKEFFILLEQGYFERYGEYLPIRKLGTPQEFREFVDKMRSKGKRFAMYFHPYKFDPSIPFYKEHTECFCKRMVPGNTAEASSVASYPGMVCQFLDWTQERTRTYMEDRIRFLISDEPDCLNADFLAIHNNQTPDPEKWQFANPEWGIGDLMTYKVGKFIYETAKKYKPDVVVRRIIADSFMQPWVDRVYINEDWTSTCDNWWKMARIITRTLPQTLVDATPWFITISKSKEFWMVVPSFGVACNHPLNVMLHPYAYYHKSRESDRHRFGSSWKVYENAPMTADQERRLDYFGNAEVFAFRKYKTGPLKGFYASMTLSNQCYATFSEKEIRVSSTEERLVEVPIPPEYSVKTVEYIMRNGTELEQPYEVIPYEKGRKVRFVMVDCSGDVFYARVRLTKNILTSEKR
ncbi:MAG: hypothetical protein HY606_08875 [Planctomycetes bacterium]|nr:hypothetical protein [Planctomycetota bacterium]